MKKLIFIGLALGLSKAGFAQKTKADYKFNNTLEPVINEFHDTPRPNGQFRKKVTLYKGDGSIIEKKKLEFPIVSNTVPIGDKWYYLASPITYKNFDKMDFDLVQVDRNFNKIFKAPIIKAREKVGGVKFIGVGMINTSVPFTGKVSKSPNQKYILATASKFWTYGDVWAKHAGWNKEYSKSNEQVFFGLMDENMNVLGTGSYVVEGRRGYQRKLTVRVNNKGEIIIVSQFHQEFVDKPSRMVIIKVNPKTSEEEKIEVDLNKFSMRKEKIFFKDSSLIAVGLVSDFKDNDKKTPDGYKGCFYTKVNLSNMKIEEKNITLFSADQIRDFNTLTLPAKKRIKKRNKMDNKLIKTKIQPHYSLLGEKSMIIALQHKFGPKNKKTFSSIKLVEIGDYGKKVTQINDLGLDLLVANMNGLFFVPTKNGLCLFHFSYRNGKQYKLGDLQQNYVLIKGENQPLGKSKAVPNFTFDGKRALLTFVHENNFDSKTVYSFGVRKAPMKTLNGALSNRFKLYDVNKLK